MILQPTNINQWYNENKQSFSPPICNKLMHKKLLTVMFVGGPNTRTDFHIEQGGELFYQLRGSMVLPIVEEGNRRRDVEINAGQVFLLPRCIPHSPQRPMMESLGLVIERARQDGEQDCLRWYTRFDQCDEILWEKSFPCDDLGKDLVPVVEEFKRSDAFRTSVPSQPNMTSLVEQDRISKVPKPFNLDSVIRTFLEGRDTEMDVFHNSFSDAHPDREYSVLLNRGPETVVFEDSLETFFLHIQGPPVTILIMDIALGARFILSEGECCVMDSHVDYTVHYPSEESVTLSIKCNPSKVKTPLRSKL